MKAIVTGFTASMSTGRSAVGFETLSSGLMRGLAAQGHEAIMKPMKVETNDADLAEAQVMFFGLAPFNALGSRYLYGALDALMKARKYGVGVVCYVSDWQTNLVTTSARAMVKKPEAFVKPLMQHRWDFEWAKENLDYLIFAVNAFLEHPWPITLVPTHPWRDPNSKLVKHIASRKIVHVDPTCFTTKKVPMPELCLPSEREKEWVLAALGDYTGWVTDQGFTWPVRYFGGKTFGGENGGRNQRIKEHEVNAHYTKVWGGLSPKYMLSGSGWWRTRYDSILRAGGVLYGSKEELYPMGEAFRASLNEIETMDPASLDALAQEQRAQFVYETEDEFMSKVMDAAREAWVGANS